MSLQSYLASSGVPVDDVRVQFALELLVRGELAAGVELVLEVAEHLLGGGVVDAVALAAHGLADAQFLFCFNVCSTGSAVFFRSVG